MSLTIIFILNEFETVKRVSLTVNLDKLETVKRVNLKVNLAKLETVKRVSLTVNIAKLETIKSRAGNSFIRSSLILLKSNERL